MVGTATPRPEPAHSPNNKECARSTGVKIELRGHHPRYPQVHDGTQSAVKERETKRVQCARALAARPASGLTAGAVAAMLGLLPSRAAVLPCSRIHTEYILRQRAGDQAAACCRLLERAADTGAAPTQLALHALQDACRRAARARRLVAAAPSRALYNSNRWHYIGLLKALWRSWSRV